MKRADGLHAGKTPPNPVAFLAIRKDTSKDHEKKVEVKKDHKATEMKTKTANPSWDAEFSLYVPDRQPPSLAAAHPGC